MKAQLTGEPKKGQRIVKAQMLQQKTPRSRVRDVYDLLLKAQKRRLLVTVQARYREHFDMLIERVAQPRVVEDGSSARFQIDLKSIRVADSQTVAAPKPAEARGSIGKNKGSQATKPADAAGEQKFASTLFQITPG
jgi:hypothetical protein